MARAHPGVYIMVNKMNMPEVICHKEMGDTLFGRKEIVEMDGQCEVHTDGHRQAPIVLTFRNRTIG
jgi:hypothetical protein